MFRAGPEKIEATSQAVKGIRDVWRCVTRHSERFNLHLDQKVMLSPSFAMLESFDPILTFVLEKLDARFQPPETRLTMEAVQHGVRLTLESAGNSAGGTIYHSAKKHRLSWVPNGKGNAHLAARLAGEIEKLIGHVAREKHDAGNDLSSKEQNFKIWIGSDEAGKGDIFGPLVVGAMRVDREMVDKLFAMGIRDSKELTPGKIQEISRRLHGDYEDRISVVEIKPKRYNEMYPDFHAKGGINGLLGWAHARSIRDLIEKDDSADGAVVDKFGGEHRLMAHLPRSIRQDLQLVIRTKGESNVAVAAGAILARARFDNALKSMEKELGFRPHPGGGGPAVEDLKRVVRDHEEKLEQFVKMHFSPVKNLGLF